MSDASPANDNAPRASVTPHVVTPEHLAARFETLRKQMLNLSKDEYKDDYDQLRRDFERDVPGADFAKQLGRGTAPVFADQPIVVGHPGLLKKLTNSEWNLTLDKILAFFDRDCLQSRYFMQPLVQFARFAPNVDWHEAAKALTEARQTRPRGRNLLPDKTVWQPSDIQRATEALLNCGYKKQDENQEGSQAGKKRNASEEGQSEDEASNTRATRSKVTPSSPAQENPC